jgi:hypothetical protein
MNTTTFLVWLIVAVLVMLIFFRYKKKGNAKADNSVPNKETRVIWPVGILILFLLLIIVAQYLGWPGKQGQQKAIEQVEGMPVITPDELASVVGTDEDHIAGVFVNKKFKRSKKEPQIQYTLYNPKAKEMKDQDEKILECAYIQSGSADVITYVLKDEVKYNNFMKLLITLGADSLDKKKYGNSAVYIGNYKAYTYKNCVFVDRKYWSDNEGNSIICFTKDLLQVGEKKPMVVKVHKERKIIDSLVQKENYEFTNTDGDFLTLRNRRGNVFQFSARIQMGDIKGYVERQGNELKITDGPGNATGKFTLLDSCQTLLVNVIANCKGFNAHYDAELKMQ